MTTGTKPSKPGRPAVLTKGANGADGPKSTFVISGLVDITAEGGKGGISHDGGWFGCRNGRAGANSGNGKNSGNGYVKLYKAKL